LASSDPALVQPKGFARSVALQPSESYDIEYGGRGTSAILGGERLFFATLCSPGKIWLQSMPLSRMARRIVAAVPSLEHGGKEEGSVLGRIGGLLDGDNN
jgi:hypothetical protein